MNAHRQFHDIGFLDLTDNPTCSFQKDTNLSEYVDHINEVVQLWNEALAEQGLGYISFNADGINKAAKNDPESLLSSVRIAKFSRDKEGIIFRNQIRTTAEILAKVITHPGESGVVVGGCLSGKTGTANNCYWLAPILFLLTGRPHIAITLIPGKKNMEHQTNLEWNGFEDFYRGLQVTINENRVAFGSYFSRLRARYDELNDLIGQGCIVRRSIGKSFKFVEDICKMAKKEEEELSLIFIIDEPHWGASVKVDNKPQSRNSVQLKMMQESRIFDNVALKLRNVLKKYDNEDFFVGFSFTPWQLWDVLPWRVRSRLAPNYCGLNMFMGEKIDNEVNCPRPEHFSFGKIALECGIKEVAHINISWYYKSKAFEMHKGRERFRRTRKGLPSWDLDSVSFEGYRKIVERAMAGLLNWCLITKNPKKSNGLLFRWKNNNTEMVLFFERLQKAGLSPKIGLEFYDETDNQGMAIKKWLKTKKLDENSGPLITIFTGAGRMGDNPPSWFKYAIDGTYRSNPTALVQGLYGRLSGVGKGEPPPMIVMSPANVEALDIYIENMGIPHTDPHADAVLVKLNGGRIRRGKPVISATLWWDHIKGYKILEKAWEETEAYIQELPLSPKNLPMLESKDYAPFFDWWNPKVLGFLEVNHRKILGEKFVSIPHFLRCGELDKSESEVGYEHEGNRIKMGFRTAYGIASNNSNLPSDRFEVDKPGKASKKWRMAVQIHIHQGKMVAIRFRLKEGIRRYDIDSTSKDVLTLPKDTTIGDKWRNYAN